MMVPDPNLSGVPDYADLTVMADLTGVNDSQADEGDLPALNFALNDFEATGSASGTKVTENSVTVTDISGNGVHSANYVAAANDIALADTTITETGSGTLSPGDILFINDNTAVGTAGDACTYTSEELMYVVSHSGTTITVVRGVNGTTAAAQATAGDDDAGATSEAICRYTAATVLNTNYMQVQATDLDVVATASTRNGSTGSNEQVLSFNVTANSAKDARFRQGSTVVSLTEGTDGGGANAVTASANQSVDGSASLLTAGASVADNDSVYWIGGDMTGYTRASFWVYVDDQGEDQGTDTVDFTQMTVFTAADATAAGDNSATLTNPVTTPLDDNWYFFDVAIPGAGAALIAADVNFGIELDDVSALTNDTGGFEATDLIYFDQLSSIIFNKF